jgi:polar amino acid transport system permease protein
MTFDISYALDVLPHDAAGARRPPWAPRFAGRGWPWCIGLLWALRPSRPAAAGARPASIIVEFIRSTPLIVQIYFLFYVLPIYGVSAGPFLTGVLALGLHYSAYMAEVYRAGIDGVPRGQWEAADGPQPDSRISSTGTSCCPRPSRRSCRLSETTSLPCSKTRLSLSAITVLELLQTAKIIGSEHFRYLEPMTLVGVLFLVLSLIAVAGVRWLEERLHASEDFSGMSKFPEPIVQAATAQPNLTATLTVLRGIDLDIAPGHEGGRHRTQRLGQVHLAPASHDARTPRHRHHRASTTSTCGMCAETETSSSRQMRPHVRAVRSQAGHGVPAFQPLPPHDRPQAT